MRLTSLDFSDLARPVPPVLSQILFGVLCSVLAIALRMLTDIWLPGAGPFALTIPLVLVATLFGRWTAGIVCQTIVSLHAWFYVLPIQGSFDFADPTDGPRVFVNLVAGYFVVALAEIFRRAMRHALADREALLLELEHRVKNSFMSIASVLRLQMRNAKDPATQAALQSAIGRWRAMRAPIAYSIAAMIAPARSTCAIIWRSFAARSRRPPGPARSPSNATPPTRACTGTAPSSSA